MNVTASSSNVPTLHRGAFRLSQVFIVTASMILIMTGIAKILNVAGGSAVLWLQDPIFGLPFSILMLLVGIGEGAAACFCLFSSSGIITRTMPIACLSTAFLGYRGALWSLDWERPCGCLGSLTDGLGISPPTADNIALLLLAYLLIGSYATMLIAVAKSKRIQRKRA